MSCADCILKEIGSSDYFKKLTSSPRRPGDLPWAGSLELTLRCNLLCRHCYTHVPGANAQEMSTDDVCQLLTRMAKNGVLMLLLTGGEIFLRRDFKAIYLHAKKQGFLITLFTNATLISEEMADWLAEWPPRRFEITIYGHTEKTYETVTGVPGSFVRFRQGVQRLLDRRLPVHFKTMVLKSNEHEFEDIRKWVADQGRPFRFDAMVNPRLDGTREPLQERLDPATVAKIHQVGPEQINSREKMRKLAATSKPNPRLFRCGGGWQTFHIDPQGFIHPCKMWRATPYDFLHGTVDGWNKVLADLREIRAPENSVCISCADRFICPNCAANSLLETGTAGLETDFFCRVCQTWKNDENLQLLG